MNIEESIEIEADRDTVWKAISDFSREKEYWHSIRDVNVFSRSDNLIVREVFQNFRNGRVVQKVILHPKNSIEYIHLRGSMKGKKVLFIEPVKEGITRLTAAWHIRLGWSLLLLSPIVKKHIREGTRNALKRIKAVCEGKEEELSEAE
ncbi:MAG: SRPBCC family protein [Conexivisphaerales archaeon]